MRKFKFDRRALIPLAACAFISVARGDVITVQGSTSGEFTQSGSSTDKHLTFTGASFGPTSGDTLTLGSFDLGNGIYSYSGMFDLTVTFTLPGGVSGNEVVGDLTGSVSGNSGSVTVDFSSPVLFTFPGGSFDLTVSNVTDDGGAATLTGTLSNEDPEPAVPEPVSVALLATCMGLLALTRRGFRPARKD